RRPRPMGLPRGSAPRRAGGSCGRRSDPRARSTGCWRRSCARHHRDPSARAPGHRPGLCCGVHSPRPFACALVFALGCQGPNADDGGSNGSESSTTGAEATGAESADDDPGDDSLPPIPTLQSPADNAIDVPISTELCWNPVEDPDGEPVRYRVFVDGMVLSEGRLGDETGHAGPCLGPLLFAHERSYSWQVEACEFEDPSL